MEKDVFHPFNCKLNYNCYLDHPYILEKVISDARKNKIMSQLTTAAQTINYI